MDISVTSVFFLFIFVSEYIIESKMMITFVL